MAANPQYQWWHFAVFFGTNVICTINRYSSFAITAALSNNLGFDDAQIGLTMSCFYMPFVFSSLIFGILGDRVSRKRLLQLDLLMEGVGMVVCALAPSFTVFAAGRVLIGCFQAAFIGIGPTVIADMFTDPSDTTKYTGIFATGPALGVALGFLSAPSLANFFGYQFVFYFFGGVSFLFMVLMQFIPEYARGSGEAGGTGTDGQVEDKNLLELSPQSIATEDGSASQSSGGSILGDLLYLMKNKTYTLVCFGFAMTSGVTDVGMAFFNELARRQFIILRDQEACMDDLPREFNPEDATMPCNETVTYLGQQYSDLNATELESEFQVNCQTCTAAQISSILGGISVIGGIFGTLLGMTLYNKFYSTTKMSGALTAGFGCLACAASIVIFYFVAGSTGQLVTWIIATAMFLFISLNFGVLTDVNNKVVVAEKRSLANSMQNFTGRLIGGNLPPYLAGQMIAKATVAGVAEKLGTPESPKLVNFYEMSTTFQEIRFLSALDGVMFCAYCGALSGVFWLSAGFFWAKDEERKEKLAN